MEIDIHLSAEEISKTNIEKLENLGYVRDIFTNNRRCEATAFHASFKEHLTEFDNILWNKTIHLLKKDNQFRGCLEEECFDVNSRFTFNGNNNLQLETGLEPFELERVETGKHKACDIHISIDFNKSTNSAKSAIESLNMISFDRPLENGFKRVYSLTFETNKDGQQTFEILKNRLGGINGLIGKMKIEKINRFFVQPVSAIQLPIVRHEFLANWIMRQNKNILI